MSHVVNRRSLYWERGLKFEKNIAEGKALKSLPVLGAWIEIRAV